MIFLGVDMLFNPYSEEETNAAKSLLEIFLPEIDDLEEDIFAFEKAIDANDDEEKNILFSLYLAFGNRVGFYGEIDNLEVIAEQLDLLARNWGVVLNFGNHGSLDWQEMFALADEELLAAAAQELAAEDLTLWLCNDETNQRDNTMYGFISRTCDDDLVEKLAEKSNADLVKLEGNYEYL